MKFRIVPAIVVAVAFTVAAGAQDAGSAPPAGQNSGQSSGQGSGGGYGHRGGRGGFGGGMGGGADMMGRGLMGTVTEVAADHYTVKTDAGDVYSVRFTADTRIVKQAAGMRAPGGGDAGTNRGQRMAGANGGPQPITATDIKVGDAIGVIGDIDATAKTVGALRIVQLDPEVARQRREMEANFGKTWLQGKVTAIDGAKITLTGMVDNVPHILVADENTAFRKRREPVTLADIQMGDTVRVEGAVKDGVFTATSVNVAGMTRGETPTLPRTSPPQ